MAMKSKKIIMPAELQQQTLDQLHNNHMGIQKARFLVRESIHQTYMNADIENTI